MRPCCQCKKDFEPRPTQKNWFICSPCRSAYTKAWKKRRLAAGFTIKVSRSHNPETRRKYVARKDVKARMAVRMRKYRQDPFLRPRHLARAAVRNALRRGQLVRLPCKCGNMKSEAHHHDYSKPLEVMWVCKSCHRELHALVEGRK